MVKLTSLSIFESRWRILEIFLKISNSDDEKKDSSIMSKNCNELARSGMEVDQNYKIIDVVDI